MKKIIIIGCPGAGKSHFAKKLHAKTGIPLYHLDMLWHKPDKTHIERDEFDKILKSIFEEASWIMDGNYSRTMEMRLRACDTVFFFDVPYEVSLRGIKEREGKKRDDMPWEVTETTDELLNEVKSYIPKQRPSVCQLIEKYREEKEIIIFKSRQDADNWLR